MLYVFLSSSEKKTDQDWLKEEAILTSFLTLLELSKWLEFISHRSYLTISSAPFSCL